MLAVTIPDRLGAKELGEPIALREQTLSARRFNAALANGSQSSNVCEFVGDVQEK